MSRPTTELSCNENKGTAEGIEKAGHQKNSIDVEIIFSISHPKNSFLLSASKQMLINRANCSQLVISDSYISKISKYTYDHTLNGMGKILRKVYQFIILYIMSSATTLRPICCTCTSKLSAMTIWTFASQPRMAQALTLFEKLYTFNRVTALRETVCNSKLWRLGYTTLDKLFHQNQLQYHTLDTVRRNNTWSTYAIRLQSLASFRVWSNNNKCKHSAVGATQRMSM